MAEFLIKKIDHTLIDIKKDTAGCYKRGDVVQVYKDGTCTEKPSPNSKMVIIKVPGMALKDAQKYTEHEEAWEEIDTRNKDIKVPNHDDIELVPDKPGFIRVLKMCRRRTQKIDIDSIMNIDTLKEVQLTSAEIASKTSIKPSAEVSK